MLLCSPALAQDDPADSTDAAGEIVVTASTRGAANVQDVPVAVTAFGAEQLQEQSIFEARDLQNHVPGLVVRDEAQGAITFAMRGISLSAENFSFDSAVGYYQNEIFVARSNDFSGSFFDIQGVEVLRGPQGIYFGRNTPTGAVLVTTARPTSRMGGYVQATLGGGGGSLGKGTKRFFYRTEGAINLPVTEQFSMRFAGFYHDDDGFGRSLTTGYRAFSRDDFGGRATAELKLPGFTATGIVEHTEFDRGSPLFVPLRRTTLFDPLNPRTAELNSRVDQLIANGARYTNFSELRKDLDHNRGRSTSATLILDYDIGDSLNVRSISGWRKIHQETITDLDGTEVASNTTDNAIGQEQWSTELLFSGDLSDRIRFLLGGIYFQETGFDENILPYQRASATLLTPLQLRGEDIKYTSKSVFGNVSAELVSGLTASGGIRYTKEHKYIFTNSLIPSLGAILAQGPETFDDAVVLYEARVDYEPNQDFLFYAKYGTGYRAGGIGFRAGDSQFQPETSDTWEVGMKSEFRIGGAPARANLAAYTSKYRNFQVPVVLSNPTRQTVVNAGTATINGVELEFSVKPVSNLTFSTALSLLDAKYDTFVFNSVSLGGLVDLTDNKLRNAPAVSLNSSLNYRIPANYGTWSFQIDMAMQSDTEQETIFQRNAPPSARTPVFENDGSVLVNARVTLGDIGNSGLSASAWVRNLTDTSRLSYVLSSSGLEKGSYTEPRAFGFDLRYAF